MSIAVGARLGPYVIEAPLGAGGMGEVYRARDTRLERTVAIKVLAAHRIGDPRMRQRFEREARAVAALSHPNICHLNDVGHDEGVDFLVMEYLEGETLAIRLARNSPSAPLDDMLKYAIEMAEALNEAHRRGVVHRDLKPGNVMLTKTGVKLLDFGLAKMNDSASVPGVSLSTLDPTKEGPLTDEGAVLGTWPYMSPEQVEGKAIDARSDIFSFGAMLYEMATGTRAFAGESHASLIAAILERDPIPLTERLVAAPPALDRVVRKCLAKDPNARWQTARDLADALKWIVDERQFTREPTGRTHTAAVRLRRWPWIAAIVTALATGAIAVAVLWTPAVPRPPVRRVVIQPGADDRLVVPQPRFDIAADGRALVYTADTGRGDSLYLRPLDQWVGRHIPGTERGSEPAFSPDGQWIAFQANGRTLKKVSATSGAPPVTLAELDGNVLDQSIDWLSNDTIVFGRPDTGLFRISAAGGGMDKLTTPNVEQGEIDHHFPHPLPGRNAILFTRHLKSEVLDVAVLDITTGQTKVIVPNGFDARFLPTGHLVFARGQSLMAARFDLDRLELSGAPVVVIERVMSDNSVGGPTSGSNWGARYAVADEGTLAYIPPVSRTKRRLAWVAASGTVERLPLDPRGFSRPALSPDGERIAVQLEEDGRRDIWIYDLRQGTFTPLTSDGVSLTPTWTRDGQRVTFSTVKDGREEIYWRRIDGSPAELLLRENVRLYPGSWSPDGQTLVVHRELPNGTAELALFDRASRQASTLTLSQRLPQQPQISPDGGWLAYASLPFPPQIHVAALRGTATRQLSTDGGFAPVWSRDGRTLYYRGTVGLNGEGDIIAVDVAGLPTTIGKPVTFAKALPALRGGVFHAGYDVAKDGRLLIVQPADDETAPLRFEIVTNWFDELTQRAAGAR